MNNSSERIDKFLSSQGVCSRRAVKDLLLQKIVTVNGKRVTEPGERINPAKDKVLLDGTEIKKPALEYYLLNKPKGYVCTTYDKHAKNNVISLVPTQQRIYPVGRLDKETTGLLILTNDGDLTNYLTHPRYQIGKTYRLTVLGILKPAQIQKLREGVRLDDVVTSRAEVKIISQKPQESLIEMTIHEGRNQQIRRMCAALGIYLKDLERIAIGRLVDDQLKLGRYRKLSEAEVEKLKKSAKK